MQTETVINQYTDVRALSPGTLLGPEDIASICRVQPDTVKKWRATGRGPRFIPVGREPLYEAGDVVAWLDGLREL